MEKYDTAGQAANDNTIMCMRIACWITKAADKHSEYVILIAFPRQNWLGERTSVLRHTYIACFCYPLIENKRKQYGRDLSRILTILTDLLSLY